MDVGSVLAVIDGLQQTVFGSQGPGFGQRASGVLGDAANLFFFYEIKEFLNAKIDRFAVNLLGRMMQAVGIIALGIMTMWVFFQGVRVMTGKSRESLMEIVMNAGRAVLILTAATGLATGGAPIIKFMADKTTSTIYEAVTGHQNSDPYRAIDKNLAYMQLAMITIDALDVSGDENIEAAKSRAQLFTGIGIAGPSLVGGTLLLLNRIMMALFIGFGPIFIMCLLFDQTKHLFSKWLLYGIGTMFSLAVLSVMVSISLDIVFAVATAFWVGNFIGGNTEGISSMALQQGGLGAIMTLLMITVPPMAANFFQGTLGQLSTVNMFSGSGASAAQARQQRADQGSSYTGGAASSLSAPPRDNQTQSVKGNNAPANLSAQNPATNPKIAGSEIYNGDEIKTGGRGRELTGGSHASATATGSSHSPSRIDSSNRDLSGRQNPDGRGSS
jgi:type IV secretion system protein VirB6